MPVCKFFQQGNCRFGQNCRFEHIYASKYNYNANTTASQGQSSEEQIKQIKADVKAALHGGQWLLSVYAPFKEKPNFPGFIDLSFEEARLFIYEAKVNNNIDQAIQYYNNLVRDAKNKYEQLGWDQTTPAIKQAIINLFKGESTSSPFENGFNSGNSQTSGTSLFRSAVAQNSSSVFAQNANSTSVFGPPSLNVGSNVFTNQNSAAKSIFQQANQSIFSKTQGQPVNNPRSIFANASQQLFNNQSNQSPLMEQQNPSHYTQPAFPAPNIFNNNAQNSVLAQNNIVQQPQNIFQTGNQGSQADTFFRQTNNQSSIFTPTHNQNTNFSAPSDYSNFGNKSNNVVQNDPNVYSKLEDLSSDELEAFKREDFVMGHVPDMPPPHSLCL